MTKKEVIEFFGSKAATARALRISYQSVRQWPDVLPDRIGYRVELATKGRFKTKESKIMEME